MKPAALLRALSVVIAFGLASAASAKTAPAPEKEAPPADPNESCMMCHADASAKGAGGKSIAVDAAVFAKSVHGEMQFKCTDCHADVSVESLPHAEKLQPAACVNCHEDAVTNYRGTAHAKAIAKGQGMAATCHDCHGTHDIKRSSDPASRTNFANIEATCGGCHGNDKIVEQAHLPGGNIQAKYHDSIHGQLIHGRTAYSGMVPTCTSCHGAHTMQRASRPDWQNAVVGACGNCHDDKITSFRHTYHGKVTTLGPAQVATCAACHGAHDVRPATDPLSTVNSANRLETCRNCHPTAGVQLVSWDPHPVPSSKERSALLYYTNIFMQALLAGVFLSFGLHTVLWAYRSIRNRLQRGRRGGH